MHLSDPPGRYLQKKKKKKKILQKCISTTLYELPADRIGSLFISLHNQLVLYNVVGTRIEKKREEKRKTKEKKRIRARKRRKITRAITLSIYRANSRELSRDTKLIITLECSPPCIPIINFTFTIAKLLTAKTLS